MNLTPAIAVSSRAAMSTDAMRENAPPVIVVFRNDDPSALSNVDHERRVADIFDRYGLPQVLGIIPNCADGDLRSRTSVRNVPLDDNPAMVEFLRQYVSASGSEIALHGYTHQTNRLSRPARREYFEFRDVGAQQQEEWIGHGTEILRRSLRVEPFTFIPPWNRLDRDTVAACRRHDYRVISGGRYVPVDDDMYSVCAVCSVADLPARLEAAVRCSRTLFIGALFHSRSTHTPEEFDVLERAVRSAAQTPECQVLTVRQAVERYGDTMRLINQASKNVVAQDELHGSPRARAVVYRRAAQKLKASLEIEKLYDTATGHFDNGRYREAADLNDRVDTNASRMLALGRSAVCGGAIALGAMLAAGLNLSNFAVRLEACAIGLIAILVASFAIASRATAADTVRELRMAGLLAAAFFVIGFGGWTFWS